MQEKSSDNIINLKEWTTPKKWDDITLKTFQELEFYYADKTSGNNISVLEILHILCHKDKDEVSLLPLDIAERIMNEMLFIYEDPHWNEPTNKIVIDKTTYSVNPFEKLKTGEFVSCDNVLRNDRYNYAAILAILCRKDGEVYDSKFEAEKFEERVKMFEECPITKIMPVISFFFERWKVFVTLSLMYSKAEEALSHTRRLIESSPKIGPFKKRYLNWRVTKLEKSLRQNNSI